MKVSAEQTYLPTYLSSLLLSVKTEREKTSQIERVEMRERSETDLERERESEF